MADAPDWKSLGTPLAPSADGTRMVPSLNISPQTTEPSWKSLGTPVPPQPEAPDNSSDMEKHYRIAANSGWLGKLDSALGGFTDQFGRAVTMGLSDKASALAPAAIHAAAKGVNALYDSVGAEKPFPEADTDNIRGLISGTNKSFSDIYHDSLEQERGASDRYAQNNPYASAAAKGLGFVASIPLTAGAGAEAGTTKAAANLLKTGATIGQKAWQGVKAGSQLGALGGFGQSNDESLTKDAVSTGIGAGVGGVLGGGLTYALENPASQKLATWVASKYGGDAVENAGVKQILQHIESNKAGGGPSAEDMLNLIKANENKPQMLVDQNIGGEGVQGLGERIVNSPGPGRQVGVSALTSRDKGAGVRLGQDLDTAMAPQTLPVGPNGAPAIRTSSNYAAASDLSGIQKETSAPAYNKAFTGGSTAPLEDQFRTAVQQATAGKATIARQMKALEGQFPALTNPEPFTPINPKVAERLTNARTQYADLQEQASQAEEARQAMLSRFQQAQADKTANAPGAVWSPKLQTFMDDPIMQAGIQHGLENQRLETVGTDTPFNPTEHAVISSTPDGQGGFTHTVGAVPNMRLIDAGKRGLDSLIGKEEVFPGQFTERGKILIGFKNRFLKEVDSLNPDYAPARAAYSGPASSKSAIAQGQYAATSGQVHPDEIADQIGKLDAGDQELYRLGAMNAIKNQIGNATPGGNEALKIMGTDNIQNRIKAIAGSPEKAASLIKAANLEDVMKQTNTNVLGSSRSGLRIAQQASGDKGSGIIGPAAQMVAGSVTGEPVVSGQGALGVGRALWQGISQPNPAVDAASARMIFNSNPTENQQTLARIIAMGKKPSLTPSLTRPLIQSGSPLIPGQLNYPWSNREGGQ